MDELDRFIPGARLREIDHVEVAAAPARAYEVVRHFDLARSPAIRRLFALRTLPERLGRRRAPELDLRIDAITESGHGFRLLYDEPGRAFALGAIGRFWEPEIVYADVSPHAFAAFAEPGWGKVAWEIRLEPIGPAATSVVVDLRVTTTDDVSWRRFQRYFRAVGPFSRMIRRRLLASVERELGSLGRAEADAPLPGDDRVPNARAQATHGITIDAPPEAVFPWLVQMGRGRAGWYSYDWLDNGGVPSATTIRPELQDVRVGDELPATPDGTEGFVVDRLEPNALLLLHGLYDVDRGHRVLEGEPRPDNPWEVSWAFVLEPIGDHATRLVVRARVDYDPERSGPRAVALGSVHHFMEAEQLRNLKRRAEGRVARRHVLRRSA